MTLLLLVPMSIQDVRSRRLFLPWIAVMGAAGFVCGILQESFGFFDLVSALIPGVVLTALALISDGIGIGDGAMAAGIGLILGMQDAVRVLVWGSFLSAAAAVICMVFGKKNRKYRLPFTPFLLAAFLGGLAAGAF